LNQACLAREATEDTGGPIKVRTESLGNRVLGPLNRLQLFTVADRDVGQFYGNLIT